MMNLIQKIATKTLLMYQTTDVNKLRILQQSINADRARLDKLNQI